jgi:hypothetical protein
MTSLIVTGSDSAYFALARQWFAALAEHGLPQRHAVGFLDLGLTAAERAEVAGWGVRLVAPGWDCDFPTRPAWEAVMPGFKAMVSRPFLRRHFPDADLIAWIDADAWVQTGRAIDRLIEEGRRAGLAAVPEVDRAYWKFTGGYGSWLAESESAAACLGTEAAQALQLRPIYNSGVWAARADSSLWDAWAERLAAALNALTEVSDRTRVVEQWAFNAAIHLDGVPVARFPAVYNWLACLALPAWDVAQHCFVEPEPPYQTVHVIHTSAHVRDTPQRVLCLMPDGSRQTVSLPLTLAARTAAQAAFFAATGSAAGNTGAGNTGIGAGTAGI